MNNMQHIEMLKQVETTPALFQKFISVKLKEEDGT